jgi:hypothetical protein
VDADELARIEETLLTAIAEAKAVIKVRGVGSQFREIVREMHDILLDALRAGGTQMENLRILPVGGPAARNVSPRVGHLHITVDDLPWQRADYGESNTIILVNLPRGEHKVLIEVVDHPEGRVLTAQTATLKSPGK